MKILLQKNKDLYKMFNDPREVIIRPKGNQVDIFNFDGTFLENHVLIKKELDWLDNPEIDCSEILVKLEIK